MEQEWDRRKTYLTRCLFEDLSVLSPIPESRQDSYIDNRPYSPLPDLIIEKEKSRHDEPDEFYEELEKRMLKLYKRLFLCQHDPGSIGSINSFSSRSTRLIEETRQNSGEPEEVGDGTRVPEDSAAFDASSSRDVESEDDSEGPPHEIITTEALIHGEVNRKRIRVCERDSMGKRSQILEYKHLQQIREDWDDQSSDQRLSTRDAPVAGRISPILISSFVLGENVARFVPRQATIQKYSLSTSQDSELNDISPIEVMRQKANNNSKDSVPEVSHSRTSIMEPELQASPIKTTQSFLEEEVLPATIADGDSRMTNSNLLNNALRDATNTSTHILESTSRKRLHFDSSKQSEPRTKRRKLIADGLQTSGKGTFSNITESCCASSINYFTGTPLVYNVCRCIDHICQ